MKSLKFVLLLLTLGLVSACTSSDDAEQAVFAVPEIKSLIELRGNITVESAQPTNSDGKIYVTQNYLFYIAQESGIHIFNNTNPANPQNIAFINLEGVHDIAVKGNYLYADNFIDLVVFDISNINAISVVQTVENAFEFYPTYPEDAEFYDFTKYPGENELIVGYRLESRNRPSEQLIMTMEGALASFDGGSNYVGNGGSFAKFQINNNALYAVENFELNVFDITNPIEASFDKAVYMNTWLGGGMFETLFKQKEFLFIGATNGMYIINAEDEFNPYFVSGFSHATACDPVVVHENTAYITVRGGSTCGAIQDQVNVIDITDISNPTLLSTYFLSQPYGLGIRNNILYVCANGKLNIFDAATNTLVLENSITEELKDVIALDTHLIAVGLNKIIQYQYGADFTLTPISTVSF
jgi:hypothetical protein